MECRQVCGEQDNLKLRMWNFELVARRAMKNYSIKIIIQCSIAFLTMRLGEAYYRLISFALIAHWCISTSFSKIKYETRTCEGGLDLTKSR